MYTKNYTCIEEENRKKKINKIIKVWGGGVGGGVNATVQEIQKNKEKETGTKAEMKETDKFRKQI